MQQIEEIALSICSMSVKRIENVLLVTRSIIELYGYFKDHVSPN